MSAAVEKAIKWARKRHDGSWRDGDSPLPYITHPVEVLTILRYEAGVTDEDSLVAAVLHDLVEDTDTTLEEIEERFGASVSALVDELTRTEPTAAQRKGLTEDEVRALRSDLLLADIKKMSSMAKVIKLCDRLSNLRSARATRSGAALERYLEQTSAILAIVPRKVSPRVWDLVKETNERVMAGAR
jgi:(p)ppGpp synthase/HD superfamily hydrolase